jgi:hypothetical protein
LANNKVVRAVDIVGIRLNQLQDLELKKMQYVADIQALMIGLSPNQKQELITRHPWVVEDPRFKRFVE